MLCPRCNLIRIEAQLDEVTMFLRLAANPPVESKKKQGATIAWDPASMGFKWPLESKREKGEKTRKP